MNKIFTVLVYSSAHVTTVISYETLVLKFDVPGHCGLVRVTSSSTVVEESYRYLILKHLDFTPF